MKDFDVLIANLVNAARAAGFARGRKLPDDEANLAEDAAVAALRQEVKQSNYEWLATLKANQIHLTYNDHASNYVTAKEWIEEFCPDDFAHDPAEAIQAMKDTNTIWTLQIYQHTPVGFSWWHRATLDEVIHAARSELSAAKE